MLRKVKKSWLIIDRFLSYSLHKQLACVACLFLFWLIFGWLIVHSFNQGEVIVEGENGITPFWMTLLPMIDPGHVFLALRSGKPLFLILTPLFAFIGMILLGGLFISSFVGVRDERRRLVLDGGKRYRLPEGQVVILGWDETAPGIIKGIWCKTKKRPSIVVLSAIETSKIRRDLSVAEVDLSKDLFLYCGNCSQENELRGLELEKASIIFVLGDIGSDSRDSKNLEAALIIIKVLEGKAAKTIPCYLAISDPYFYFTLQKVRFFKDNEWDYINLRPFNNYEQWAQKLWSPLPSEKTPTLKYRPLAHKSLCLKRETHEKKIYRSEKNKADVHLIIIGFGKMGQLLALEAARVCHYGKGCLTKITVIDQNFSHIEEKFSSFFSLIFCEGPNTIHDIEFKAISNRLESSEVREFLEKAVGDPAIITTVAICFSKVDASLLAALSLPVAVKKADVPILVRQKGYSGLNKLIESLKQKENDEKIKIWKDFQFFGGLGEFFHDEGRIEKLAQLLNALYKICDEKAGAIEELECYLVDIKEKLTSKEKTELFESLDDFFWNNQNAHFRWSSRYQATAIVERIRSLGFELVYDDDLADSETLEAFSIKGRSNETAESIVGKALNIIRKAEDSCLKNNLICNASNHRMAEAEHDRWWAERTLAGWEYSEITDKKALLHSDMVPFNQLDKESREKDLRVVRLTFWLLSSFMGIKLQNTHEDQGGITDAT